MGFLQPVRDYIATLVHPSAHGDALTTARHRAFIGPRRIGSAVALASFPACLALRGVPGALEVVVFGWLIAPICTAFFLSGTGRYESAHVLSSLALTGVVTMVTAKTGGITSFAAIWLVIVPLEAALSASRRVVATASTLAICAAGLLIFSGTHGLLPAPAPAEQGHGALAALGIISAALYATGLALGAESLARTSLWLLWAEEDRYRLLARNMTDVITRHARSGSVQARESGLELVLDVPSNLPEIVADKRALNQIVINLLSNAIKFTDRSGRVEITAAAEGAALAITVEDNGIGIGEKELPRIGKPFYQARGSYERRQDGTGLGLSIVNGLVVLHGGEVLLRSRIGEGTRITVRLPLDGEQTRPPANPAAKPTSTTLNVKSTSRASAEGATFPARDNATVVQKSA